MSDCTQRHERFDEVAKLLPEWVKPGVVFYEDNTEYRYLGEYEWRDASTEMVSIQLHGECIDTRRETVLNFYPISHVYSWVYKGEIHLGSFENRPGNELEEMLSGMSPSQEK